MMMMGSRFFRQVVSQTERGRSEQLLNDFYYRTATTAD